jgi:hypothetical protein
VRASKLQQNAKTNFFCMLILFEQNAWVQRPDPLSADVRNSRSEEVGVCQPLTSPIFQ